MTNWIMGNGFDDNDDDGLSHVENEHLIVLYL